MILEMSINSTNENVIHDSPFSFLVFFFYLKIQRNNNNWNDSSKQALHTFHPHRRCRCSLLFLAVVFDFTFWEERNTKKKLCDGIVVINKNSRLLFLYALTLFLCIFKLHAFGARKYLKCRSIIYVFCGFILLCNMSYWFYWLEH